LNEAFLEEIENFERMVVRERHAGKLEGNARVNATFFSDSSVNVCA
jgi:hypothetical protein